MSHGLYLLLVVRNDGGPLTPTSPPADLDTYAATLGMALDRYRDALAVVMIEDEIGPASTSYAGSTAEYLAELKVGCETAHARKLRCSNAALPSTSLLYVLADYYRSVGFEQESRRILQAAKSNPGVPQMFKDGQATTSDVAAFLLGHQAEIDSGKQLLAGLRDAGVDYVNLHSYEEDLDTFDESVALMRSATTCNKVIIDELGQRVQDGADASHRLADAKELGLPFVIWSSPGTSGAAPVVDAQGNLLPSGTALETASTTATCSD